MKSILQLKNKFVQVMNNVSNSLKELGMVVQSLKYTKDYYDSIITMYNNTMKDLESFRFTLSEIESEANNLQPINNSTKEIIDLLLTHLSTGPEMIDETENVVIDATNNCIEKYRNHQNMLKSLDPYHLEYLFRTNQESRDIMDIVFPEEKKEESRN